MEQRRIAASLVRKFKTRDPFRIADELGFIVIRTHLEGIRGFWHYAQRQHLIFVDDKLPDTVARFVCAHEIGHILMHRGCNRIFMDANTYFPSNRHEVEANRFAVDLLYDDEDLRFFLDFPIQLAADFMGVDLELAEYRLRSINPHP